VKLAASSTFWNNPAGAARGDWLARMSGLGFDGVTLFTDYWVWGDSVGDGSCLRAQLAEHQMRLASLVTGVHLDFDRYRQLAGLLPGLGCEHLVLIGGSGRRPEDRQALAGVLNRVGEIAFAAGVHACYHHHTGTSGESLADVIELLWMTDPALVQLAFDSGHAALDFTDAPGPDRCAVAFRELRNRIGVVEFKDLSPESELDTVLGDGTVDFRALVSELAATGHPDWLVIEQNPELERSERERDECARRSLDYLASLLRETDNDAADGTRS
jgi:sugar phosphate isomerase/epimerase